MEYEICSFHGWFLDNLFLLLISIDEVCPKLDECEDVIYAKYLEVFQPDVKIHFKTQRKVAQAFFIAHFSEEYIHHHCHAGKLFKDKVYNEPVDVSFEIQELEKKLHTAIELGSNKLFGGFS